jgi:hypothetical protein
MLLRRLLNRGVAAILLIAVCALSTGAYAKTNRSGVAVRAFMRENPCPSTGERRGSCPGHVIDHIEPLCAGGQDDPVNMQWQTIADSKTKDIGERRLCRSLKAAR